MTDDKQPKINKLHTLFPYQYTVLVSIFSCVLTFCAITFFEDKSPTNKKLSEQIEELKVELSRNSIDAECLNIRLDALLFVPTNDNDPINQLEQEINMLDFKQEKNSESIKEVNANMHSKYDDHRESVNGHIMFYSVLITLLIAFSGVMLPILLKNDKEKYTDDKIKEIEELSKNINDLKEVHRKTQASVDEATKLANDAKASADETRRLAEKVKISEQLGRIHNEKDLDSKISKYSQIIKLHPKNIEAYFSRAEAYFLKNMYDGAILDLTIVIDLDPTNLEVFFNRALVHLEKGRSDESISDFTKAISDFTKAIDSRPNDSKIYINRALVYVEKNMYKDAILDFTKAIDLKSDDPIIYHYRGLAYSASNMYDEAILDYTRANELDPNYSEVYISRMLIYKLLAARTYNDVEEKKYLNLASKDKKKYDKLQKELVDKLKKDEDLKNMSMYEKFMK